MQYRYDSMGNIIEVSENGRMVCRNEYDALNPDGEGQGFAGDEE